MARTNRIVLLLSDGELADIAAQARVESLPVATWGRRALLQGAKRSKDVRRVHVKATYKPKPEEIDLNDSDEIAKRALARLPQY